jgi:signal peptidase II
VSRRDVVFVVVLVLSLLVDLGTKLWIEGNIAVHTGAIVVIPGFFEIVHAQNPGAAMGMLRDNPYRYYLFLGFTAVATVVILDLFRRLRKDDVFMASTLGLILSGAFGNAICRLRHPTHHVTDFLRFFTDDPGISAWLRSYHLPNEYPSFNVADAALVVGVGMFLLHYMFLEEKEPEVAAAKPADAPSTPAT